MTFLMNVWWVISQIPKFLVANLLVTKNSRAFHRFPISWILEGVDVPSGFLKSCSIHLKKKNSKKDVPNKFFNFQQNKKCSKTTVTSILLEHRCFSSSSTRVRSPSVWGTQVTVATKVMAAPVAEAWQKSWPSDGVFFVYKFHKNNDNVGTFSNSSD